MSEEIKIESQNKINKKLLISVAVFIALALVALLIVFAPKTAGAKKIREQLSLGEKYLSELEYEQAEAAYLAVIKIDPKNADAYLGLADVYAAQGEYDKAIEVLENALSNLSRDAAATIEKKLEMVCIEKAKAEVTPTPKPTVTGTPVPTATSTPTPEPMATNTPIPTVTNTPTPEPMAPNMPIPTVTNTPTPEPIAPNTPIPTATSTPTPVPTLLATEEGAFLWKEKNDGTIEITGVKTKNLTMLVIPEKINGKKVSSISESAIDYMRKVEEIHIPASVEKIGYYPEKLSGSLALRDCKMLRNISVSEENLYFSSADGILYSKDKTILLRVPNAYDTELVIDKTVLGSVCGAFDYCSMCEEIYIPASMQIGQYADFFSRPEFNDCLALKNIWVAEENPYYKSEDGILFNKNMTQLYKIPNAKNLTKYRIPDSVTNIGPGAFYGCNTLETVYISENVYASQSMIGSHVYDGNNYFRECASLKAIVVAENNPDYVAVDGVLYTKDKSTLVSVPRNYEERQYKVLDSVITIASYACYQGCLEEVELPDTLKYIGERAFGSSALEFLTMPSCEYMQYYAFDNCYNLKEVILPDNMVTLQNSVLASCKQLKSVFIPANVTEIGNGILSNTDAIIITPSGSYAEQYANSNGILVQNP